MARITTTIFIFTLLLNSVAGVMAASGFSEDIGVSIAPGVGESMDQATEALDGFDPSVSIIESFVSLAVAAGRLFQAVITGAFALPSALINMGIPAWAVTAFAAPLYVISTLEIVAIMVGRETV